MDAIQGLRQRATSTAKDALDNIRSPQKAPVVQQDARAFNLESVKKVQEQAAPLFVFLATLNEKLEPLFNALISAFNVVWAAIEPYHPEDLLVALYGFFLVFFGGVFMTLVASFEAAHQFGWDRIKSAGSALYLECRIARVAFERDNKIDANWDGIADVEQLDAKDLAARRLMVLTKSVNPENVSAAIEGLTIATVAVLATLRVRFAKAITLGTAIGQVLNQMLSPFTTKMLQYSLSDDYERWIPTINKYGFRYLGMSFSWILMRVMTTVFAALRGSSLFITGICGYLMRHSYVGPNIFSEGNPLLVASWCLLAVIGVYTQISSRFTLPFPLNLLLLPFTIAEQVVVFAVGVSAK